jgi:ribonucleoside-diphosphate reductase alpha chain
MNHNNDISNNRIIDSNTNNRMFVINRDGNREPVLFDKITARIEKLTYGLDSKYVCSTLVSQKVCGLIIKDMHTTEIDELCANTAVCMITTHPDYGVLASRIAVSNLHKETSKVFTDVIEKLHKYIDKKTKKPASLISDNVYKFIMENKDELNSSIIYNRDYNYEYFGFKTLERSYLLRINGEIVERPQHMLMRVACGIHCGDIKTVIETYNDMSNMLYTQATPTLFNAGTRKPQLSSCFLLSMKEDSIDGIYDTLKDCAKISQCAGGIGLSIHNVRAQGSYIRGTNGHSNGILPMLRVFNNSARYVDQCFSGDTNVLTKYGYKKISEIYEGESDIYTSSGDYATVNKVLTYEVNDKLLLIDLGLMGDSSFFNSHPLVTKQHQMFVLKNNKRKGCCNLKRSKKDECDILTFRLLNKLIEPEMVDAQEIWLNDFVVFPAKDERTKLLSGIIKLNLQEGDCFMFKGFIYVRVQDVIEMDHKGKVYDLELDEKSDHTYVSSIGICHNGGGKRKGSIALYLEPHHADIYDFLHAKLNTGADELRARDLFYALWMPDLFMKRVEENGTWSLFCPNEAPNLYDVHNEEFVKLYEKYEKQGKARKVVKARDLWKLILDVQQEVGQPYMLYKDACNRKSNQQNLGTIRSSNLCVAGDTYVLTKTGQYKIKDLVNKETEVWNGKQWSKTTIFQTGTDQELLRVELTNGAYVDCTPYHKFWINDGIYVQGAKIIEKEAKDLQEGDRLIKWDLPIDTNCEENKLEEFKYPYTHGFFCGDGTYYYGRNKNGNKHPKITLYGEKKELLKYLDHNSWSDKTMNNVINVVLPKDINPKFTVPINYDIDTKIKWFEGYCDADACITKNIVGACRETLQVASIHKDFLLEVKLMLQTIGVDSKITKHKNARKRLMPDGNGGEKLYDCKEIWRLLISSMGIYRLLELGFSPKRLIITNDKPNIKAGRFVKVLSITKLDGKHDTFCFTEPLKNTGVFNGILTKNCSEIVQYSSPTETAVCNLASIALPKFVNQESKKYDFEKLRQIAYKVTKNLDNIIDANFYPVKEAETSNKLHRPIGLGIQGLADVFMMLDLPYDSPEAQKLNSQIFETIYYGALQSSIDIAKVEGVYSSFAGSPASKGILQFDMWNEEKCDEPSMYDWKALKEDVKKFGLRNSLLTTVMPTASSSQILGNNEGMEAYSSNLYVRRVLSGEFTCINNHMVKKLIELGLWSKNIKDKIIMGGGSVQHITEIPKEVRDIFKTSFEIATKVQIDMSAERGRFIDQSQSFNLFMKDTTKLQKAHFYGWKKGLKTGMYYLRTKPATDAIKITVDASLYKEGNGNDPKKDDEEKKLDTEFDKWQSSRTGRSKEKDIVCDGSEGCTSCSA